MRSGFDAEVLNKLTFLVGTAQTLERLTEVRALEPFSEGVVAFLDDASKHLMGSKEARDYSDVITFAFWIRRASVMKLRARFQPADGNMRLGRGVAFHIAPSNVPVNFAWSLAAGLLLGNANVVRVSGRSFPQVRIIAEALNRALEAHGELAPYVNCVQYPREKAVNDAFSALCDVRVIWGGDRTVAELRQSPLPPRANEITFADRYSLAVIDAEAFLAAPDRDRIAMDFCNDAFFADQNACTSPRLVAWTGADIDGARAVFWEKVRALAGQRYALQPVQAVDKLASGLLAAARIPGLKMVSRQDNLVFRVEPSKLTKELMDYRVSGGFFYEYCLEDIMELVPLCDDRRCQTVAYCGDREMLRPLIEAGVRGVDRIVPLGKTMDFDLIWDGYDLPRLLTRVIAVA